MPALVKTCENAGYERVCFVRGQGEDVFGINLQAIHNTDGIVFDATLLTLDGAWCLGYAAAKGKTLIGCGDPHSTFGSMLLQSTFIVEDLDHLERALKACREARAGDHG